MLDNFFFLKSLFMIYVTELPFSPILELNTKSLYFTGYLASLNSIENN